MSNTQKPQTPVQNITSMPDPETTAPAVEVKQPNIFVRAGRKIKNTPPKTALAVAGGLVLVGAGAFLGRSTAPYHVEIVDSELELEPLFVTPASDDATDTVA